MKYADKQNENRKIQKRYVEDGLFLVEEETLSIWSSDLLRFCEVRSFILAHRIDFVLGCTGE